MIVTRTWLEEFIDLKGITDDALSDTFNAIGLEVDSVTRHTVPDKVVVGRIVACNRHPDADKLSLCLIDIGEDEPKQIVCGAANVVDAEYVAVATIGAVLPGDFEIKPAKLRGVESFGMVCSAEELGLPKTDEGIMILDESIGTLEVGRPLKTYPPLNDTVIELELTANRGDCLSIHGVARDLSAALDRPLRVQSAHAVPKTTLGIARKIAIQSDSDLPVDLQYFLAKTDAVSALLIHRLRLGYVGVQAQGGIETVTRYATHATGVILRAYNADKLYSPEGKITLTVRRTPEGAVRIGHDGATLSLVGIAQAENCRVEAETKEILFEASYIEPDYLVETVATHGLQTDALYYNTSRGSEPDLTIGSRYVQNECAQLGNCLFYEGDFTIASKHQERTVGASVETIGAIIGNPVRKATVHGILKRLGFDIRAGGGDTFGVKIPPHRHDITNVQDIAEEVLRIIGIDNVEAKPLMLVEKNRLTAATRRYRMKRDMRQRAVAAGFYEAVTYAFADRSVLEAYGFETVDPERELVNPIVEEFNTLRTTLSVNILDALKRNVSYGIKRIALFEVGAVFDAQRRQHERIVFAWSGQREAEGVPNHGKPAPIDFATFVDRIGRVIGGFELRRSTRTHALIHPYQSADVVREGRTIGWITKVHPTVAKAYDLGETFMAELDMEALMPRHILAQPISNYQGVYKDISVVVDATMPYSMLSDAIASLALERLKRYYVVDVYEDASLEGRKSVTIRLFVQSHTGTLSDREIDETVQAVLNVLETQCQATLR
jgi:phenylalanyl-tRNA synthetase beta chain